MKTPSTVSRFLAGRRIAVVGVSRNSQQAANLIYRKLRGLGYEVFAVNPLAEEVEGDKCYRDVAALPDDIDGAVVVTRPEVSETVVRDCARRGIGLVWLHRSFGPGSVSDEAVAAGRELGVTLIPGGCPMMFAEPDFGHRCMRFVLGWTKRLRGS